MRLLLQQFSWYSRRLQSNWRPRPELPLAGMPFVFGAALSQNMGVRLFFGMMLGGTFMIVDRAVQKFGGVYDLPAILTLLAPPLVLMLVAIFILRRSV